MTITPINRTTKTGEVVVNVPAVAATDFLPASDAGHGDGGIIMANRPKNMDVAVQKS